MGRALRVVKPDGEGLDITCTMAEALADMVAIVAADKPAAVLIVWQTAEDDTPRLASLPGAHGVKKGLICDAYDVVFPQEAGE